MRVKWQWVKIQIVPPVNIPIQPLKWVVHLPQNGTIGFDPKWETLVFPKSLESKDHSPWQSSQLVACINNTNKEFRGIIQAVFTGNRLTTRSHAAAGSIGRGGMRNGMTPRKNHPRFGFRGSPPKTVHSQNPEGHSPLSTSKHGHASHVKPVGEKWASQTEPTRGKGSSGTKSTRDIAP